MDRLEHLGYQFRLGTGDRGEHIAVKMDGTAMVFGVREYFPHSLQHAQALAANDELYAIQTAPAELLAEADPAGLVPPSFPQQPPESHNSCPHVLG